jgi:peptidoglycan/LPS O-acetylase OafA/YrhL
MDTQREIRALTGIRGIAALMVVLYHFQDKFVSLVPGWSIFAPTAGVGLLGVDLFFILSGFILCFVYRADESPVTLASYHRFVEMRIARVYPNHIAMLVAMGLLVGLASARGAPVEGMFPLDQLPFQASMTHAWFRSPGMEWNYPSWSISSEWFAYLFLFPVGAWYLRRQRRAAVSIVFVLFVTQSWLFIANSGWHRELFPLIRVLCGFSAGVALFGVARTAPRLVAACQRHATALLLLFVAAVMVLPAFWSHSQQLMLLLIPALIIGLTSDRSRASRWLGSNPAVTLGRLSYALYMSHVVTESALEMVLPASRFAHAGLAVRAGVLGVYWGALLAGAALLYALIEAPARAWLRQWGRPRAVAAHA